MDEDDFWTVMERAADPEALHATLREFDADALIAFERLHDREHRQLYDWGLWAAAYVIGGGCSDDGFDYFRSYLLSLGRTVCAAALADPDSLADLDLDDGEEWEDWSSPTMTIVRERTGEYGFAAPPAYQTGPVEPAGEDWDEVDLPERLPRLWALYGEGD